MGDENRLTREEALSGLKHFKRWNNKKPVMLQLIIVCLFIGLVTIYSLYFNEFGQIAMIGCLCVVFVWVLYIYPMLRMKYSVYKYVFEDEKQEVFWAVKHNRSNRFYVFNEQLDNVVPTETVIRSDSKAWVNACLPVIINDVPLQAEINIQVLLSREQMETNLYGGQTSASWVVNKQVEQWKAGETVKNIERIPFTNVENFVISQLPRLRESLALRLVGFNPPELKYVSTSFTQKGFIEKQLQIEKARGDR